MSECEYLKVEDVTPWHGDVFDHPDYEYYCMKKNKKLLAPFIQCLKCEEHNNGEKENNYMVSTV